MQGSITNIQIHTDINSNRKYEYFDQDLLKSDTNKNQETALCLPQLQLNVEQGSNDNDDEKKMNNIRKRKQQRIFTAYQCYVREQKSKLLKNDSSITDIQISQQLAKQWKQMTLKQKQEYVDKAKQTVKHLKE